MGATNIRFPETSGIGIKPVSKEGTERLVRAAIQYALDNNRKSVTLVHKGNIMKFTEGSFKQWGYDLAHNEFGDKVFTWQQYDEIVEQKGKDAANEAQSKAEQEGKIIIKDSIADIFLQQILTRPAEHDVVATMNLMVTISLMLLQLKLEALVLRLVLILTMKLDMLFLKQHMVLHLNMLV